MKRFKTVKQYENQDCGPACISTLLRYYGVKKNPYLLRHDCGTDQSGSSILGVQNCLNKNNFDSAAYKVQITENNIDHIPKPFIQVEMGDHQMNHYIVVFAKENDTMIIGDPKKGTMRVNINELYGNEENKIIITVDTKDGFKEFHKRNWNIRPLDIIIDILKKNKKDFIITNLLSGLLLGINLFILDFINKGINTVVMNKSMHEILMVGIFFLGLCSLKAVIDFIRQRATVKFLKKSDIQMTTSIFRKLINAPLSYFNSQNTGEIISKIANVDSLRNLFSFVVNNLIINAIFAGALFVMVFNISWVFLIITMLQVLINLALYIFNEQKIKKYQIDLSVKDSDIQSSLIDLSKGIEEVKVYNLENKLNESLDKKYSDYAEFNTDFSLFLSKKQILGDYFSKIFLVISIIIGYIMMINNEIDVGGLIGYVYINNSLVSVCSQLVNNFPMIEQARVAFFRLSEILNQDDKEKEGVKEEIQDIERIEVENLEYRYNFKKKIFNDIAIQINKSEKIAIMGPTGCGKTTLAKIISGLFSSKENSVRINGQNIQDIDDISLKENIIYVSQFPNFFAGTIFENIIALNDSEYDFVEVEKLVQKLEMNDIFANHAYGIHSKLSENASNLSGGQRQKLSLLRALIKKPKVLVLDEATSNLDLNSEKKVIDYLLSLKDTIVIFISHKKYLNDRFDKVYEFNNGKLIEQGV